MSLPGWKDVHTSSEQGLVQLVWSAIGAAIAVGLALCLVTDDSSLFLLASLGGSIVFLFGLTDAEAAQPRALFWWTSCESRNWYLLLSVFR